jgi:hypothetical protein
MHATLPFTQCVCPHAVRNVSTTQEPGPWRHPTKRVRGSTAQPLDPPPRGCHTSPHPHLRTPPIRLSHTSLFYPPTLIPSRTACALATNPMGNLCGKESKDNFEGQGRTLGSAPAPVTKASVPSNVTPKRTVGGPPRTLGEGNAVNDPKSAAAAAAEVRSLDSSYATTSSAPRPMTMRAWM